MRRAIVSAIEKCVMEAAARLNKTDFTKIMTECAEMASDSDTRRLEVQDRSDSGVTMATD